MAPRRRKVFVIGWLILLLLGVALRFWQLDRPLFWHDEVYTAFYLSGEGPGVIRSKLVLDSSQAGSVTAGQMMQHLQLHPERGAPDTVVALLSHDPHHPPLYYVGLWLWCQLFGDSFVAQRAFSVFAGLLLVPAFYWLCRELFRLRRAGFLGAVFITVAPFQVAYARESRPYSWWAFTIALCCAALLHAIRTQTRKSWLLYCATLTVAVYTHLFSLLVVAAHIFYVCKMAPAEQRGKVGSAVFSLPKNRRQFATSTRWALLAFVPWLLILGRYARSAYFNTNWTASGDTVELLERGIANAGVQFIDIGSASSQWTGVLALVLISVSLIVVWRTSPLRIRVLIFSLIGWSVLPLLIPDVILGGQRSVIARFIVPCWIGITLAVVYLLSEQWQAKAPRRRWLAMSLTSLLVVLGVFSAVVGNGAQVRWYKGRHDFALPASAQFLNSRGNAMLISDTGGDALGTLFSLATLLSPAQRIVAIDNVSQLGTMRQKQLTPDTELYFLKPNNSEHRAYLYRELLRSHYRVQETAVEKLWAIYPTGKETVKYE